MGWTKVANLGVDLLATLVAGRAGLVKDGEVHDHVARVLDVLEVLPTYRGIFPEVLKLDGPIAPEVVGGRIRYSSLDSAWATVALSLVTTRSDDVADRARALIAKQDYGVFVGADGLLGAGFFVDAKTNRPGETFGFSYGDRNSEARPLVNALVGLGKLPVSTWSAMQYGWVRKEDVVVARGWQWSAFVEMTGQLFADEAALSPRSLGRSHAAYLDASVRVARRGGHMVFGYAPACDPARGYAEYGLDRPDVVTPYAAALLATTRDPRAVANLERVLDQAPLDGTPAPDGLDPVTGRARCAVSRSLDQGLFFLSLYADVLASMARQAAWYPSAEQRLRAMDRLAAPPPLVPDAPMDGGRTGGIDRPASHASLAPSAAQRADATQAAVRAVRGLVEAVRSAERAPGSASAVARAERDVAAASAVATWADLMPTFSVRQRREDTVGTIRGAVAPVWWLELHGRATFSLEKVQAGLAAGDAEGVARVTSLRTEEDAMARGLALFSELLVAERREHALMAHLEALRTLASGPHREDDAAILAARVAALNEAIAKAEGTKAQTLARLRGRIGASFENTSFDPQLALPDVLGAFAAALAGFDHTGAVQSAAAEVTYQKGLLRVAESRAAYVPDVRAAVLDVLAERIEPGTPRAWVQNQVLGEATIGINVQPGSSSYTAGRRAAVEASLQRLENAREDEREEADRARARRDAAAAAWSSGDPSADAAAFEATAFRYLRGEIEMTQVVDASKAFEAARAESDDAFADAVDAQIALCLKGSAMETGPPVNEVQERVAAADPDARVREAVQRSAVVQAAEATAAGADMEADGRRWSFRASIEGGVLHPFYLNPSGLPFGATGLSAEGTATLPPSVFQETSLLGRIIFSDLGDSREASAARAEAELRRAEAELTRKTQVAAIARARVELAYARAALRLSHDEADFTKDVLSAVRSMAAEGLFDDDAAVREAGARAAGAAARYARATGDVRVATIRLDRLLGRAPTTSEEQDAATGPPTLSSATSLYRSSNLLGFEPNLRERVAELEEQWADAKLIARRSPPHPIGVTFQATQGLEARSFSFGLGLHWSIDPIRDEAAVAEAASRAGEATGNMQAVRDALARERAEVRQEIDQWGRLRDLEASHRDRIAGIVTDEKQEEASRPDVHESAKVRATAALRQALYDADWRLLSSERQLARAQLRGMDWGLAPEVAQPQTTPTPAGKPMGLDAAVEALVDSDADVAVTAAVARALDAETTRVPILGGFRIADPAFGLSNEVVRTPGSTVVTGSVLSADLGTGISYAPDQGFAFAEDGPNASAAKWTLAAARRRARMKGLAGIARAFGAREALMLATARRDEARRRVEGLAVPRFHAGHVDAASLAAAQATRDAAEADVVLAQGTLDRARITCALAGVVLSDGVLDEFARFARQRDQGALEAALRAMEASDLRSDPVLQAARARQNAAWGQVLRRVLSVASPLRGFVELEPFGQRNLIVRTTGSQEGLTRGSLWDASLTVPIKPKAIFDAIESVFLTGARQSQVGAIERSIQSRLVEERAAIEQAFNGWQAARERRRTAEAAFDVVDRQYRAGAPGLSVERWSRAQDDVFEAERVELVAQQAAFDTIANVDANAAMP
jgi:outer membrane protein TolC